LQNRIYEYAPYSATWIGPMLPDLDFVSCVSTTRREWIDRARVERVAFKPGDWERELEAHAQGRLQKPPARSSRLANRRSRYGAPFAAPWRRSHGSA